MTMKISGKIWATLQETECEIVIDLLSDIAFSIKHNEIFINVSVNDGNWCFEKETVKFELI